MTVSLNWIMTLPAGMSAEKFDHWYLGTHTRYGKASANIQRYVVNRALAQQPALAVGQVYRIAQEYWPDWDRFEACWNSPSGHAVLGDGLANIGLDPATIPGIAITADTQFEVAQPANFSTIKGGYRGSPAGTLIKLLAYGSSGRPDLARWYADRFADLGRHVMVREHVFGTSLRRSLRIGYLSTLPGPGQTAYDWVLELWFDDLAGAQAFFGTETCSELWNALAGEGSIGAAAVCRGQEMLVMVEPVSHLD